MFDWIKKAWKAFEERGDERLKEYLKKIEVKEAKPDPFCDEEVIRYSQFGHLDKKFFLVCSKCGASKFASISKEAAIKSWNKRIGDEL